MTEIARALDLASEIDEGRYRHKPLILGWMALYLFTTSYVAMAAAGLIVELLFRAAGLVPTARHAIVPEAHISLNYTTALNVVCLTLAAALVLRCLNTGGAGMLKMLNEPAERRANGS